MRVSHASAASAGAGTSAFSRCRPQAAVCVGCGQLLLQAACRGGMHNLGRSVCTPEEQNVVDLAGRSLVITKQIHIGRHGTHTGMRGLQIYEGIHRSAEVIQIVRDRTVDVIQVDSVPLRGNPARFVAQGKEDAGPRQVAGADVLPEVELEQH